MLLVEWYNIGSSVWAQRCMMFKPCMFPSLKNWLCSDFVFLSRVDLWFPSKSGKRWLCPMLRGREICGDLLMPPRVQTIRWRTIILYRRDVEFSTATLPRCPYLLVILSCLNKNAIAILECLNVIGFTAWMGELHQPEGHFSEARILLEPQQSLHMKPKMTESNINLGGGERYILPFLWEQMDFLLKRCAHNTVFYGEIVLQQMWLF